jgi:hypothetical protein
MFRRPRAELVSTAATDGAEEVDMPDGRTITEIETWFSSRMTEIAGRERDVWEEYLHTTQGLVPDVYAQAEPLAWRRLRRSMAALAHDRRRDAFERDRAVAELHGLRLAS